MRLEDDIEAKEITRKHLLEGDAKKEDVRKIDKELSELLSFDMFCPKRDECCTYHIIACKARKDEWDD